MGFGLGGCIRSRGVLKAEFGLGLGLRFGFGFGFRVSLTSVEDDGHAAPEGRGAESRGCTPADESGLAGVKRERIQMTVSSHLKVIVTIHIKRQQQFESILAEKNESWIVDRGAL